MATPISGAQVPTTEYKAVTNGTVPRRKHSFMGLFVFGESGVVDTTNSDSPRGCTPSKPEGTGLYLVTIPPCLRIVNVQATLMDASGGGQIVTGKAATASTGLVYFTVTDGAASAADGTSGDSFFYEIVVEI